MISTMKKLFIHSFIPLFLGLFIYLGFRQKNILLFKWLNDLSLSNYAYSIRRIVNPNEIIYENIFVFNLPDGLWVYSFTSVMLIVWQGNVSRDNILYVTIPLILAIVSELGQFFGLIMGTFDVFDLLFYILAFILSFIFCYVKK